MMITGGCNNLDLHSLTIEHVEDLGSAILVKGTEQFTITEPFYKVCKKYVELRPANASTTAFFLQYQNGKCILQRMGNHLFEEVGHKIAAFLNLPNPEHYSVESFQGLSLNRSVEQGPPSKRQKQQVSSTVDSCQGDASTETATVVNCDDEASELTVKEEMLDDVVEDDFAEAEDETSVKRLSEKSRKTYEVIYSIFMSWRSLNNLTSLSENVIMAYLKEASQKYKRASLCTRYYVLRNMLIKKHNVDIGKYESVQLFIKEIAASVQSKGVRFFNLHEVEKFIAEAPDDTYLAIKVRGSVENRSRYEMNTSN